MKIAIDAMGGDLAPHAPVEGALAAAKEWPDTQLLLVGKPDVVQPLLGSGRPSNISVVEALETIEADDEPVRAVRRKPNSSMVVAARLVKEGEADAMISSGNTGALMTAGLLVVGRMKDIERPGLTSIIPSIDKVGVLTLDLGANMDAKPEHLLQYAMMGSLYRQKVHGISKPRVGLLNVGTEAGKGNELTKVAFELLEQAPIHFIGNVEARDVLERNCDVLVCDGFAGNILLKALEGAGDSLFKVLKAEMTSSLMNKLAAAVLKPSLRRVKQLVDYREHNGAPLLGVNGLVVKSHGSSNALATKNAIRHTRTAIQNGLIAAIADEFGGK
ncbi:phosphate acyltransferase PlsX [Cohnella lubricantis]|uniref:Phosphate acyltransferase n=1 Tax=Cohnella lubricantis TaxID=2163172 RepID=A0A841TD59_9BACL|nr:phosphate acyltransferase PlsX [Cohnella lubricantis]MBB6677170.1 phosphate acyltransferase PlsX [Cohnella lubricantis]MBP2117019.1 glycerol-3-phosphate acyltransferase PlsX [Cohnella lubricantis]